MGTVNKSRLKINRVKISEELRDQAALFAFAAEEAELLQDRVARLELKLEVKEDKLAAEIRHKYRNVNIKLKPNETTIRSMVNGNEEVLKIKEELLDLKHAYRLAKIRVESFTMKGKMLESMAFNIGAERKASEKKVKV